MNDGRLEAKKLKKQVLQLLSLFSPSPESNDFLRIKKSLPG
jgi:hypothetical protein